jgi:hypothetical protein
MLILEFNVITLLKLCLVSIFVGQSFIGVVLSRSSFVRMFQLNKETHNKMILGTIITKKLSEGHTILMAIKLFCTMNIIM